MATVTESRSSDRRNVSWRARILLAQGQVLDVRATDASSSGLGLLCPKPVAEGSLIQLAVQVPVHGMPGKFQIVTGKVRVVFQVLRGSEYQLGVEWKQLEPAMREAITRSLDKLAQPPRGN